jgi:hypothetical protein
MNFLKKLFGGTQAVAPVQPAPKPAPIPVPETAIKVAEPPAEDTSIWDISEEDNAVIEAALTPPTKTRRRRNATRLLGFESSEDAVVDLFDQKASAAEQEKLQFPVGWVLVLEGEGRGHCFGLTAGLNQVGRGEENSIKLDFGDSSISRKNHFAVVYDDEERKFMLGHGGKSNIVRLNGKAVISNEDLADGDLIKVGSTVLQLKTLCGPDFDWSETEAEEGQVDVAIA